MLNTVTKFRVGAIHEAAVLFGGSPRWRSLSDRRYKKPTRHCQTMIAAARANHIKLMIAYRLHLEPANLHAVKQEQKV
jgi:hypothetical protein